MGADLEHAVQFALELLRLLRGSVLLHRLFLRYRRVLMVEINAVSAGVERSVQFFHLPVPKPRTDDLYFAPLAGLKLHPETELYLGLVHRNDMAGNAARLTAGRRHARVDGVATECGMVRGDPKRFSGLLTAHVQTAKL